VQVNARAQRHKLSDWLGLHELEPALCREILSALAGQVDGLPTPQDPTAAERALDVDVAWLRVVEAMCSYFPRQRALISETFACSPKIRAEHKTNGTRALTLASRNGAYPTILYSYGGSASDLMVMAHEFAHAVQTVASRGRFVAPIMREVCAFFGEIALLDRVQSDGEACYLDLQEVWHADARKYLLSDGNSLLAALSNPDAAYRYSWNYPIARYLSVASSAQYSRDRIWMLFEGNLSVRQVLQECAAESAATQ
jgi:hypothetical protein